MKLIKLIIEYSDVQMTLFSSNKKIPYDFKGEDTLITSNNENTCGKTTLIRFILYSLGYRITQTDGMEIYKYKTTLEIEYDNNKYFFIRDKEKQEIRDINGNIKYNTDKHIPMISVLLGIENDYISESLLGCFYIDQEKGWTLLNRGSVIGKIKFNIEEFFINLDNKFNVENNFIENKLLTANVERANALLKIIKDNYVYNINDEESRKNILKIIKELEDEKNAIEQISYLKKREIKNLENILLQNEEFSNKIESLNIVIEYKGEDIIVNKNNLKHFNFNNEILKMKLNELKLENKKFEKDLKKIKSKITQIRKENQLENSNECLKRTFNLIKNSGLSIEELELLKSSNKIQIRKNNKIIEKEISNIIDEFWDILHPILNELKLGKIYNNKEIITIDKLAGKSGSQMHQLSLAFKVSLNKLIEKKLNIRLPFIVDSPKASETSDEISDLMLKTIKNNLQNHQIIVSSAFDDFKVSFKNKIELNDGVVKELNRFI